MAAVSHCGAVPAAHALGAGCTAAAGFAVSIAWCTLMFGRSAVSDLFSSRLVNVAAISAVVIVRLRRQGS